MKIDGTSRASSLPTLRTSTESSLAKVLDRAHAPAVVDMPTPGCVSKISCGHDV